MGLSTFAKLSLLAVMVAAPPVAAPASPANDDVFLGRWDITATGTPSGLPRNCWLELKREDGQLKGRFNAGGGAVFDLPQVAIEGGELKFQYGKPDNPQVWQGTAKGAGLTGTAHLGATTLAWTGERGPAWPATPPRRKPGKPIDLFNGNDVSNWLSQDPHRPMGWSVKDGILMNEGKGANNIYSRRNSTTSTSTSSSTWTRKATAAFIFGAGMKSRSWTAPAARWTCIAKGPFTVSLCPP